MTNNYTDAELLELLSQIRSGKAPDDVPLDKMRALNVFMRKNPQENSVFKQDYSTEFSLKKGS